MPGVQNHKMVQAVPSDRADEAFGVRILPRTLRRSEEFSYAQRRDSQANISAVDGVSISNEIPRRIAIGEGLHDLLRRPGRRRMFGYVEVQHLPTTMVLAR
jgi:hypothetical protein